MSVPLSTSWYNIGSNLPELIVLTIGLATWLTCVSAGGVAVAVAVAEDDPNQLLSHETTWPSMVAVTQTEDGEAPGVVPDQLFSQLATFPSIVAEILRKRA